MPDAALPKPWPTKPNTDGLVSYRRTYRDALGRPMSGTVTLTGESRVEDDGHVVVPAPVTVNLVNGVLRVHLVPDTYAVAARLVTPDNDRIVDNDTVIVRRKAPVT